MRVGDRVRLRRKIISKNAGSEGRVTAIPTPDVAVVVVDRDEQGNSIEDFVLPPRPFEDFERV